MWHTPTELGRGTVKDKEEWMELCEQAAVEQDAARLMTLIQEIERLLQEKADRLDALRKVSNRPKE